MTEDIVYEDSAWPTTMHGHAEVRPFLTRSGPRCPTCASSSPTGRSSSPALRPPSFYWRGTGRFTGPLDPPGFAPTGKPLEFFGADFQEYREGRVSRLRIVFDNMDVARQLGLLPQPGSRADRAGAAAQRAAMRCARCAGPEPGGGGAGGGNRPHEPCQAWAGSSSD